ncbi:hypothetical protein PSG01_05415 [Proteus mirabilis]|uniref:hypothetical protein n=1 Tax=Proteus mirabilis TaxID=584 RepID=UPI00235EB728|nr:hypothetical protein [Proteus mirabilis]MDC9777084.1 hypothetical protein [Proteus mirabilis]
MKRLLHDELLNIKTEINKLRQDKNNTNTLGYIQEKLLEYHYWIECKCNARKIRLSNLRRMKRNPANTKKISMQIKSSIIKNNKLLDELKELKIWLRNIGNSIPHIYYDKGELRAYAYSSNSLNLKELSGDIHGKDGLDLELKNFRYAIDNNIKVLLNDLTSIIRYGDITLMNNETPHIIEIKSSDACRAKANKQLKNLQKIYSYLDKDISTTLRGGGVVSQRFTMSEEERSNRECLNKHFKNSKDTGYNLSKIEDGLYCLSFYHGSKYQENLDLLVIKELKKPKFFSLNQFKNEEDNSLFYPYPLLIDDPEIYTAFMLGFYSIYFFFDCEILDKAANNYNIDFSFITDKYLIGMKTKDGPLIYSNTFTKALVEFSSINWVANQIFANYQLALDSYESITKMS